MKKKHSLFSLILTGALLLPSCQALGSESTAAFESSLSESTSASSGDTVGTSSESSVSSETTVTSPGVKVHWDSYESATVEENLFTRLPDTPSIDFVPSDDYGEIFPYYTQHMLVLDGIDASYDGSNPVGFFSENGTLLCEPVFDDYLILPGGDYLVKKYKEQDPSQQDQNYNWGSEEYNRSEYYSRYGIISHDGAHYTGLIYDDYSFYSTDPNCDTLYLVTLKDEGVNVISYRCSTRETIDSFDLAYTPAPWGIFLALNNDVCFSYSLDGYSSAENFTHRDGSKPGFSFLEEIEYSFLSRPFGQALLFSDKYASEQGFRIWNIFDFQKGRVLPYDYTNFVPYSSDKMLMARDDGYDLIGENGRIRSTLDNSEHEWTQVSGYGGYMAGIKDRNVVLMDDDFKELKTFEKSNQPRFVLQENMETDPSEIRYISEGGIIIGIPKDGLTPVLRYSSAGSEYLYSIGTGATYDMSSFDKAFATSSGHIICEEETWYSEEDFTESSFVYLDPEDLHVIFEGKNLTDVVTDQATGKEFLLLQDRSSGLHATLVDPENGEIKWEVKDRSTLLIVPVKLVNGYFHYMTYSPEFEFASEPDEDDYYDSYIVREINNTSLSDNNGKVVFRYKSMHRDEV